MISASVATLYNKFVTIYFVTLHYYSLAMRRVIRRSRGVLVTPPLRPIGSIYRGGQTGTVGGMYRWEYERHLSLACYTRPY